MGINRCCMTGTLVLCTPMHIGSGKAEAAEENGPLISAIEAGIDGNAYITASALKGIVRDGLYQVFETREKEAFENLFGMPPPEVTGSQKAQSLGGKAHFLNAHALEGDENKDPFDATATAINEKTGTAKTAHLRSKKLVPANARFAFELIVDNISDDELAVLQKIGEFLENPELARIGAGGRFGYGQIKLEDTKIKRADAAFIVAWLNQDTTKPWAEALGMESVNPATIAGLKQAGDTYHSAGIVMHFDGYMLTQDAQREEGGDNEPSSAVPLKYGDDYVLTGRSVIGVLRARARRICATLSGTKPEELPSFVELFGHSGQSGALETDIFTCTSHAPPQPHEMVAIDRFTGGGKPGAKFTSNVLVKPVFEGSLRLCVSAKSNTPLSGKKSNSKRPPLSETAQGLLAFVLRDLKEGDLTFGSGTTKGYGALENIEINSPTPSSVFAGIANHGSDEFVKSCVEKFLEEIAQPENVNA